MRNNTRKKTRLKEKVLLLMALFVSAMAVNTEATASSSAASSTASSAPSSTSSATIQQQPQAASSFSLPGEIIDEEEEMEAGGIGGEVAPVPAPAPAPPQVPGVFSDHLLMTHDGVIARGCGDSQSLQQRAVARVCSRECHRVSQYASKRDLITYS